MPVTEPVRRKYLPQLNTYKCLSNCCHSVYPHGGLFRSAVRFRKPRFDWHHRPSNHIRTKFSPSQSLEYCPIRVGFGCYLCKYGSQGDERAPFIAPSSRKKLLRACGSAILHGFPPSAVHAFSALQEHFADTHTRNTALPHRKHLGESSMRLLSAALALCVILSASDNKR